MPGPISAAITNALMLLSTEHAPSLMTHVHRQLQDMSSIIAGSLANTDPQTLFQTFFVDQYCSTAQRNQMITQYAPQAVSMGVAANTTDATTLLNSAFDCACSARVDDRAITTLYTTAMSIMQQNPPDMQTLVNQVADVIPAVLGSGLLCSSNCQTAWKTLARFALDTNINVQALAWAQTVATQHGLPDTDAKVSYAFITTTANSMVDCMCGGIDYRAFITPAIPYIMNEIGGRTFAQIQNGAGSMSSLLPGGSSGSPPPPFPSPPPPFPRMNFPPISFAFPPMPPMPPGFSFGRRLQSSPVAALPSLSLSMLPGSLSNMSATALGLATTYVPLIFSSAGFCGGRCKASMENVMELGARTATILATAQLRHTGASATAIARVADVHRLSPGATQATANCLCGTGASFDWAGIINLGYDMATADRFEVSIMRRALKKIFGGQALCGGSCPEMMSSMGQIGTTLLEGFSMQQIGGMVPSGIPSASQLTGAMPIPIPTVPNGIGRRLSAISDSLFGLNMTTTGVTAVHNIVTNMPQCICSPNFNWDGLVNTMEAPIRNTITTGSHGNHFELPITSMLTDSGGCASSHCTSVATDAFQLMTSITAAYGAPELPTCTASTAATCTSRCFRCTQSEPTPQLNASLEMYLRESGYSPDFVQRTVGSGPSRGGRAEIMSRFMRGGSKLDAEGVPCSSECQRACATESPFVTICSLSQSCPPQGVAGYRVKFRANLAMTRAAFTEALQTEYKTNVAEMFNGRGADVNASMIELEIADAAPAGRRLTASAQISVTSSVSVASPIAQAIVTDMVSNLTASSMSTYLGSSFAVTDVADPTTESVSGTTGTINAPAGGTADAPSSPSSGSGNNMGLIIGAIAGGVVAGALFAFLLCYFLGRRTATPMVTSGPTVATEKPTSGLVTHPEKTVTGYM